MKDDNIIQLRCADGPMWLIVSCDEHGELQDHVATFYKEEEALDFLYYKDSLGQRYSCCKTHRVCHDEEESC